MSTYLAEQGTRVKAHHSKHLRARLRSAENQRERYLNWLSVFIHLLAGSAFAVAGALTYKFFVFISLWEGIFLNLVIYAIIIVITWLAERAEF